MIASSMYCPPNTNANEFIEEYRQLLCDMKRSCKGSLVVGLDHNLDFLKSHQHNATQEFITNPDN